MNSPIVEIDLVDWKVPEPSDVWIDALESGRVLYFPHLAFELTESEKLLLSPKIRDPKKRNISLDIQGVLKGALGDTHTQSALVGMIGRFRTQALQLIESLLPRYQGAMRIAPTSYRPMQVEIRSQSWRADDRRLHVDAFPSRPNAGERILRVFTNLNPQGEPRIWRIGEPFESIAKHFLLRAKPYIRWQAKCLRALGITKSLRTEYDHLMLQLHDAMKADLAYQQAGEQITMPFAAGSVWICFSDQTPHAVMSGQYMMEQTFHLPVAQQYKPEMSPLAVLTRMVGYKLSG